MQTPRSRHTRGVALAVTLWVLAILGMIAATYALTVQTNTHLSANFSDELVALGLARAGLEVTLARLTEGQHQYSGAENGWDDRTSDDDEMDFERGTYRVRIFDEGGKLDVNRATEEQWGLLLDDDRLAAAVMDWIDEDDETRPDGCESFYYEGLTPSHSARNGAVSSVEELGLVRDMTLEKLWGDAGLLNVPRRAGEVRGLVDLLTVTSIDSNLTAEGEERVNVNTADQEALSNALSEYLTEEQIQAIIAYRDDREESSTPTGGAGGTSGTPGTPGTPGMPAIPGLPGDAEMEAAGRAGVRQFPDDEASGGTGSEPPGFDMPDMETGLPSELLQFGGEQPTPETPAAGGAGAEEEEQAFSSLADLLNVEGITTDDLSNIADLVTTTDEGIRYGLVNINTAPAEVLATVTGLDENLAEEIVRWRQSQGAFESTAQLLEIDGMDQEVFAEVAGAVTVRSYVFTIEALGQVPQSGIVKLIRCTVDVSGSQPNILRYAER